MESKRTGAILLVSLAVLLGTVATFVPPVAQPLSYHDFAEKRGWLGIANFGDVASNLGFAIVGIWGLWELFRERRGIRFQDSRERWPYFFVFLGLLLTAAGSSYYHLAPDNGRLVWDRLPMTIVFMGLVAAMIAERISVRAGIALLPVLLVIGAASVFQWQWSETHERGDLRF